jgi:diguanylate cyclase
MAGVGPRGPAARSWPALRLLPGLLPVLLVVLVLLLVPLPARAVPAASPTEPTMRVLEDASGALDAARVLAAAGSS